MRTTRSVLLAILTLVTGCCAPMGEAPGTRATGYRGSELRRPALTVRLELGPELSARDRADLPALYAGILARGFQRESHLADSPGGDHAADRPRGGAATCA